MWRSSGARLTAYVSAYPAVQTYLATNGFQKILFGGASFGPIANNAFTAPVTGYYRFDTAGAGDCDDIAYLSVFVQGIRYIDGSYGSSSPVSKTCSSVVASTVYMATGEVAEIRLIKSGSNGNWSNSHLFVTLN